MQVLFEILHGLSLTTADGNWTTWSNWTDCSVTCGRGASSRSRTCTDPQPNGGMNCSGNAFESQTCRKQPCAVGKYLFLFQ